MPRTNYVLHLTDSHGLGPGQGHGANCLGKAEMMVVQDTALTPAVAVEVGDIMEPARDETVDANSTFFRAIVTSVGNVGGIGTYFTARIVPTGAWYLTWSIAALSVDQLMNDMRAAWTQDAAFTNFVTTGASTVGAGSMLRRNRNGTTTEIQVQAITFWQDAYNYKSRQAELHDVTGTADEPVYYDHFAKLAFRVEITAGGTIVPGDIIGNSATPAWTAVCIASDGNSSPNAIYLAAADGGTPSASDPIFVQDGAGTFNDTGRTVSLVSTVPTSGLWVPYSPTPGLEENLANQITGLGENGVYDTPPRGSWAGKLSRLGIETALVPAAFQLYANEIDAADRNVRVLSYSTTEEGSTAPINVRGGIVAQELDVTNVVGTPVLHETVSQSVSGWSAKVLSLSDNILLLYSPSGTLDVAEALSFGTSGATADVSGTVGVLGWRRGSKHYEDAVARYQAAVGKPNGLADGAAAIVQKVLVSAWEGDVRVVGRIAADLAVSIPTLLTATEYKGQQLQYGIFATEIEAFINDLINDSRIPVDINTEFSIWSHKEGADGYRPTLTDPFFSIRIADILVAIRDTWNRGAGQTGSHTKSTLLEVAYDLPTDPTSSVWLDIPSAIQSGRDAWSNLGSAKIVPADSSFEILPVLIIMGQSQAEGACTGLMIDQDRDVSLYMTSQFPPAPFVDTTRDSIVQWNFGNQRVERYDLAVGSNSAWNGLPGQFGFDSSLVSRLRERFTKLAVFKAALGGSCVDRDLTDAKGCWHPLLTDRPKVTRSDLTFADEGATWSITTATPNGFASLFGSAGGLIDATRVFNAIYLKSSNGSYNFDDGESYYCDGTQSTTTKLVFAGAMPVPAGSPSEAITVHAGPPPLWPYVQDEYAKFVDAILNLGGSDQGITATRRYVPVVRVFNWEQWESDARAADNYLANLTALFGAVETDLTPEGLRGGGDPAKIVVLAHQGSPYGTDEQLATIREAQLELVGSLTNAKAYDPSDLALEHDKATLPPYVSVRQENGIHFTKRATITKGFGIDELLNGMPGIPDHPTGSARAEYGASITGTFTSDEAAEDGGGEEDAPPGGDGGEEGGGEEDGPGAPGGDGLIVEDGSGYDNADAYVSVADADTILAKYGAPTSWAAATTERKAEAIRRATREWMEGVHQGLWRGVIQHQTQRLSWPRLGAHDDEHRLVASSTIPWQIPEAVAIVAADVVDGGVILPTGHQRGAVLRETKKGAGFEKTLEYEGTTVADSTVRRHREAEALIFTFVDDNAGAGVVVT